MNIKNIFKETLVSAIAAIVVIGLSIITVGETDSFVIRNNHVHDGYPVRGEGIVLKDGSSNGKAYGNHVHHIPDVGIYIDAQTRHTYNIEVYQNTVHDIFGEGEGFVIASEAGGLLENVSVYNNIGYNNDVSGIGFSYCCMDFSSTHPVKDIKVINNTFYNNDIFWGGGIIHNNPDAQNVIIRNNIISENLSFQLLVDNSVVTSNVTVDHNLIDGYRSNTAEGETMGNDYVESSPIFTDAASGDFHIEAGSPAIDAGSSVDAPADDFEGNSRSQGAGYDIGAFEY